MAWSSGKNNPSKDLLTSYDDSSSEDEDDLPVLNIRFCNYESNELVPNSRARNSSIDGNSSVGYECSHSSSSVAANKVLNIDCMTSSFSDMKLNKSLNNLPVNSASSIEQVCSYGHPLEKGNINGGSFSEFQQPNTFSSVSNLTEASNTPPLSNQIANQVKDHYLSTASEKEANFPVQQNNFQKSRIITEKNNGCMQKLKSEKQSNVQNNPNSHGVNQMYNWQASMTTVKERFAFLFNNEILSDVHFRVGRGESSQRIPAHKFVLAVGSAVFDAMFNGKLSSQQEEIELPDVEPQAFLALLRFLYSDEVQIGPETVMTVLYTAKKYAVPALERQCVEYLKCNLSPDNAFMLLTQARLFDEPQLAALCLETIDKSTHDALLAEGFTDIDHETLCLVLERDTLRIREAKLFQAVVRWSEAKCNAENLTVNGSNQRNILGRALSLVRFPLMTIEEFAQGPAQSYILTDREIVQLFLYFTVNPKSPVNFLDIPRCCMTGKEQTVCRFQQIESRWGYSGTSDRIRFIVDRRIFVVGFGMYGSIHGPSEYEVTIQLIHTVTGKVCISNDTTFISDGTVNTFRVMFKEPFEVLPNTNYTVNATLKGPDSHYGTKGVRKISVECPSGDRVTFQFTYAAGNNNGTSVDDGQIPEIIFYT